MSAQDQKKSNFKILIVDDSKISLNQISENLQETGFTSIEQTTSPKEGFQLIQNIDYHLYILDLVMPEISGIDLAKEISKKDKNSCILMLSSLDSENVLIESIANGARDFLPKPFSKENLTSAVNKLFEISIQERIF